MKVRTYRDKKTGKIGIVLIPEFCAEEGQLIEDLLNKRTDIIKAAGLFNKGIALVREADEFSPFSAIENSKGKRFHLCPFKEQHED